MTHLVGAEEIGRCFAWLRRRSTRPIAPGNDPAALCDAADHAVSRRWRPALAAGVAIALALISGGCGDGSGKASSTTVAPPATTAPVTTTTMEPTSSTSSPTTTTSFESSKYLSELGAVVWGSSMGTGDARVNGQPFLRSVWLQVSTGSVRSEVQYDLGRHWRRLEATVGLRDDSPTASKLRFEAFDENERPLYNHLFGFGESKAENIDVTGVLRLKLVVSFLGTDDNTYYWGVWGDAHLVA